MTEDTEPLQVALGYRGEPVYTTPQLARILDCAPGLIRRTLERDAVWFEEGEDFHVLRGEDLRTFTEDLGLRGGEVTTLHLWTEPGAINLARLIGAPAELELGVRR